MGLMDKVIMRNCKMAGGASVAVLAGLLIASPAFADNDTIIDQVNVNIPVSCTFANSGSGNTYNVELHNGDYEDDIGTTTLKAMCNDTEGFSIYAIGFTGDTYGATDLIGTDTNNIIHTGTATSGNNSAWAMKLATNSGATYPATILNSFDDFHAVPSTFTKVATRASGTDVGATSTGSVITANYAVYVSDTQIADTYTGKVRYVLVHPASEEPLGPQPSTAGYINYYANTSTAEGTMGRQAATDGNTVTLFASNFSRDGYGFAGWSDAFDYATNANAHFYGPNEDITVPNGTTANGLSLYAVWVPSVGTMQANATSVCSGLTAATVGGTRTLASVSALTDTRDGQTYAIAKLADNKCWMIENLRLADAHTEGASTVPTTLTTANTNNPLNDNDATNPTVTLKLNYSDSTTATHLSPTSNVAYNADTAPEGWCTTNSAACDDQSRLRTDNTASRATYTETTNMTSANANLYSYGNYYNWYSATAGRGVYSSGSNVNTVGDLCPTGWRVPRGGNKANESNNEFWPLVVTALNNGVNPANYDSSTTPYYTGTAEAGPVDKAIRTWPNNFLHSGNVNGASLNDRGSSGSYWSSTAYNNQSAYGLNFRSSYVYPGTGTTLKYYGRTVRCLVSPGA